MIARPSYGGEREPDSHPTPGPPTLVQSAREQPSCASRIGAAEQPGGCPFSGVGSARASGRPPCRDRPLPRRVAGRGGRSRRAGHRRRAGARGFPGLRAGPAPGGRLRGRRRRRRPWAAVAAHNGTVAHRLMQWPAITGAWDFVADDDQPELWNDSPAEGHLVTAAAERLAGLLAGFTTTPDACWFAVWTGDPPDATTTVLAGRPHRLVRGSLGLAAANFAAEPAEQGPNLWWPADRAWCVVTDIDLMSTYVGGSEVAVAAVLSGDGLEAWPARPGDPVTPDSDPVNPPPE